MYKTFLVPFRGGLGVGADGVLPIVQLPGDLREPCFNKLHIPVPFLSQKTHSSHWPFLRQKSQQLFTLSAGNLVISEALDPERHTFGVKEHVGASVAAPLTATSKGTIIS